MSYETLEVNLKEEKALATVIKKDNAGVVGTLY